MSASAVAVLSDGNCELSGKHCKCCMVSKYCMKGDGSGVVKRGQEGALHTCQGAMGVRIAKHCCEHGQLVE
jgi:hypothetical protein